jgi:hypothetical protein
MEVKFTGEEDIARRRPIRKAPQKNFLAKLIIKLHITEDERLASRISVVLSVILIVWGIVVVSGMFTEEPIDPKYYYGPESEDPNDI